MANSKKKCCCCKNYYTTDEMIKNKVGWFCGINCVASYSAKRIVRKQKQERVKRKKILLAGNLPKQKKLTQAAFNKMRRLEELFWFKDRGLEPTCISCGKTIGNDQWACGHFKTVGAQPGLRFDRKNTYLQHNRRCNHGLSGDISGTKTTHGYRVGLAIRFGDERAKEIIDYCESNTSPVKWTCEQLISMRKEFNAKIRKLICLLECE